MFKKLKNQKGMGVAVTLMAILLITLLGTAIVVKSVSLASIVNHKNYAITSLEAAKAGVAYAVYEINRDMYYNQEIGYHRPVELSGYNNTILSSRGYYKVRLTNNLDGVNSITSDMTGYIIPAGCIEIVSTGYSGNPSIPDNCQDECRIITVARKIMVDFNPFQFAAFGEDAVVSVGGGGGDILTDSYNSEAGYYDPTNPGSNGHLASNTIIEVPHKTVNGELHITSDGTINVPSHNGTVVAMDDISLYRCPQPPRLPVGMIRRSGILEPGHEYGLLDLAGNQSLTLTSGNYIFDSIYTAGNATISIQPVDTNGDGTVDPVNVWVHNIVDIGGNGIINTGKATDLFLLGMSRNSDLIWKFHGNANLTAAVYAPKFGVEIGGAGTSGEIFGSLVARTVTFNGTNTQIHYDEALGDLPPRDVYVGLNKKMSWIIE